MYTNGDGFANNSSIYKLSDAQQALLKASPPIIDIYGEVNKSMFHYVRAAIMYLRSQGCPSIEIIISSPGGDVESGLDVYDLIRLYPGHKRAIIHDQAASMGAMILQAADERNCAQHSHVLIHHISRNQVSLDTLDSDKRTKEMRDEMRKRQQRLYKILAERTGKKISVIRTACRKDEYMDAEDALEFGLIDKII